MLPPTGRGVYRLMECLRPNKRVTRTSGRNSCAHGVVGPKSRWGKRRNQDPGGIVISSKAVWGPRPAEVRIAALVGHALACHPILVKRVRNSARLVDYFHKQFSSPMAEYRRRLPHFHPDGEYLFVTWRLHGSFPVAPPDIIYATPGGAFAE